MMTWKYDDDCFVCGKAETEERVLFECNRYGEERERWRGVIQMEDDMHEYDVIKWCQLESDEKEKETISFLSFDMM